MSTQDLTFAEPVDLRIPEVLVIRPKRFVDARGYFVETYSRQLYARHGIVEEFVQDNLSKSALAGTIRGLHFQTPPFAQAKLVRCSAGAILDVAVDVRRNSPTFGRHVSIELSSENGWQLFIPVGFAHGLVTLVPDTEVQYKVSAAYAPTHDAGIAWDDPDLGIDWGVQPDKAQLSAKDAKLPRLRDVESPFNYEHSQ